jgi:hypothetical protein
VSGTISFALSAKPGRPRAPTTLVVGREACMERITREESHYEPGVEEVEH